LEESKGNTDAAQILIVICCTGDKFPFYEELASVSRLLGAANEEDLFTKAKETPSSSKLKWGP
jgi:hypothetical protein